MCLILDLEFKIADSPHPKFFGLDFWNLWAGSDELPQKIEGPKKKKVKLTKRKKVLLLFVYYKGSFSGESPGSERRVLKPGSRRTFQNSTF